MISAETLIKEWKKALENAIDFFRNNNYRHGNNETIIIDLMNHAFDYSKTNEEQGTCIGLRDSLIIVKSKALGYAEGLQNERKRMLKLLIEARQEEQDLWLLDWVNHELDFINSELAKLKKEGLI